MPCLEIALYHDLLWMDCFPLVLWGGRLTMPSGEIETFPPTPGVEMRCRPDSFCRKREDICIIGRRCLPGYFGGL
jgi:hypothetical protein